MKHSIISFFALMLVFPLAVQSEERLVHQTSNQNEDFLSDDYQPIYQLGSHFDTVIRGQNPQTFAPGVQPGFYDPNAPVAPPIYGGAGNLYGGPAPLGHDPFTSSPYASEPLLGNPYGHGVVGPQPVRFGWTNHFDAGIISKAGLNNGGAVSVFELDWRMDYVKQAGSGWIWSLSPEFNYTNFNFRSPPAPNLADNYYRFGYRFQATSPSKGPVSWRLGFTPAIATDLQSTLNSGGWNFDADATLLYRATPQYLWVLGVSYWDRAEDFVLPNAGLVWTPNQFWEIRALFPKSRAEVFVGSPRGVPMWLYAGAEYDVQSWQSGELPASGQLQTEEWRAFTGARWESGCIQSYIDVGYVLDRKYKLDYGPTDNMAPKDAFTLRLGVKY